MTRRRHISPLVQLKLTIVIREQAFLQSSRSDVMRIIVSGESLQCKMLRVFELKFMGVHSF